MGAKQRDNKSADPSFMNCLSPRTKNKVTERRNSWMHMKTSQLTRECKKRHIRRLSSKPTKLEMVNSLIEAEFGTEQSTEKAKTPRSRSKKRSKKTRNGRSQSMACKLRSPGVIKEDKSMRCDEGGSIAGGAADIVAGALSLINGLDDNEDTTPSSTEETKKRRVRSSTPKARKGGKRASTKKNEPSLRKGSSVPPHGTKRNRRASAGVAMSRSSTDRSKKRRQSTKHKH